MTSEWQLFERYRVRRSLAFACPADGVRYFHPTGLRRHMAKLHHACRFCPKAYVRVTRHEKLTHPGEYAKAEGLCQ